MRDTPSRKEYGHSLHPCKERFDLLKQAFELRTIAGPELGEINPAVRPRGRLLHWFGFGDAVLGDLFKEGNLCRVNLPLFGV